MNLTIATRTTRLYWRLLAAVAMMLAGILLMLCGCASKPATPLEQHFFNVSNPPPIIEVKTNVFTVNVTKTNEIVIPITNLQNVVEYRTNVIVSTVTVPQTNVTVDVHEGGQILTPNANAKQLTRTASETVGTFNPLLGGIVGSGLAAFFSVWGWLRSNKRYVGTATALTQNIELIRNFVKTLPNGQQYDQVLLKFITDHQKEAGVIQNVMAILDRQTSNADVQLAAQQVRATIEALNAQQTFQPANRTGI